MVAGDMIPAGALSCVGSALVCVAHVTCGSHDRLSVHDYCGYAAAGKAQLERCLDRTAPNDLKGFDTNAGRFGRGELEECLADAGPFCKER